VPDYPTLRVAVAGLGFMGRTHIRAWYNVAGAEVTAIVSGSGRKLSGDLSGTGGNLITGNDRFNSQHLKHYSTLAAALADPEIDALDLCLPTHLHAEAGQAALRSGKHVFLEKPLARTSSEAHALAAQAQVSGRTLMAGHVLRFFPELQELARQLSAAPVKLASFRRNCARPSWSPWLADSACSGGAPLDLLIHDADFVFHCFGRPNRISAVGLEDPASGIDWLSANCSYASSGPVNITGGWHPSPGYPFSMEFNVVTDQTTLDWSSTGRPLTSFRKNGGAMVLSLPEAPDPWVAQLQHFTDSARACIPPALSLPTESAEAVRFVEIMQTSRQQNGEPLPWTD